MNNGDRETNLLSLSPPFIFASLAGPEWSFLVFATRMDIESILGVLEKQPSNGRVFKKLNDWIDEVIESGQENTTYDERIVRVCLAAIERHCTKRRLPDQVMISVSRCLAACVVEETIGLITLSEHLLRFIFKGFDYVEAHQARDGPFNIRNWNLLDSALITLLEVVGFIAGSAYRTTVFVRYFTRLQRIFCYTHALVLGYMVRRPEYYGIVVATPTILQVLIEETNYRKLLEDDNWATRAVAECYSFAALTLMATAESLGDEWTLQELLGYGLLNAAGVLKSSECDQEADMFRRILEKYPSWRRHFVGLTEGGDGPVALLRDEIARHLRKRKAGVDLVFYNEEIVDF